MTTLDFGSDELLRAFVGRALGADVIGVDWVVKSLRKRLAALPLGDVMDAWAEIRAKAMGLGPCDRIHALGMDFIKATTPEPMPVPDQRDREAVLAYCDWEGPINVSLRLGVWEPDHMGGFRLMDARPTPGGRFSCWDYVALRKRDGDLCHICSRVIDFDIADRNADDAYTIDHVEPSAAGGAHEMYNWRLAHRLCNSKKRDSLSGDFDAPDLNNVRFQNGSDSCAQGLHCWHYVLEGEGPVKHATERFCHCPVQLTADLA